MLIYKDILISQWETILVPQQHPVSLRKHSTLHRDSPPRSAQVFLTALCLFLHTWPGHLQGSLLEVNAQEYCFKSSYTAIFWRLGEHLREVWLFVKQCLGPPLKIGCQAHLGVCFHLGKIRGICCVLHKGHTPRNTWCLSTVMDIL